MKIVMIVEATI